MSVYIGIDPGKSGAAAAIFDDGTVEQIRFNETPKDILTQLESWAERGGFAVARIEKVHAMRGNNGRRQGVSSTFKFGVSFGLLQGLLWGAGIPFDFVTPQKWQKEMGCLTKGDKNVSKEAAQRMFPKVKVIHANADALLIAAYTKQIKGG